MGKADYKKVSSTKMKWLKSDLDCSQFLSMKRQSKRWRKKTLGKYERRRIIKERGVEDE